MECAQFYLSRTMCHPEMCLKDTNYLLLMLIHGPKALANDIDVYLLPLIDKLNDLGLNGALAYDANKK